MENSTTKVDSNEEIRFKPQYVARGFFPLYGFVYLETFDPACKKTTIRILMQIAVEFNLTVHQLDVNPAYLNASIDFELYMNIPDDYRDPGKLNKPN